MGALLALPAFAEDWPHWSAFKSGFISNDGRVVDWQEQSRTVSEGQAYALFFALVAGDRETFARLLTWTRNNLSGGDMGATGLAWLWGHDPETDTWGVRDSNPASDADMFVAYALLEAGRLWNQADYRVEGRAVLERIERTFLRRIGDTAVLQPGLRGFNHADGLRTNPSYLPPFQLRRFASQNNNPFWSELLTERLALLRQAAPRALPPDWVLATERGYRPDPLQGTLGSYDAIRVYLWEGMESSIGRSHPLRAVLDRVSEVGYVPEQWDVATGWHTGEGPPGFQLCLAVFAERAGEPALARRLESRVQPLWQGGLVGRPARYYDQVLALFARGYREGRFRFDSQGRLRLSSPASP
ncbi:MAG: cellulose synthase complex periplasmic endoglucanase BcsZ [Oceanococcaceae bacterium]